MYLCERVCVCFVFCREAEEGSNISPQAWERPVAELEMWPAQLEQ